MTDKSGQKFKRYWRYYRTESGNCPVQDFLDTLDDDDAEELLAEMRHVAREGKKAARHLSGEIYEVRATGENRIFRVLFASLGHFSHVLLGFDGFSKKTQRTPPAKIALAKKRLKDWIKRGEKKPT